MGITPAHPCVDWSRIVPTNRRTFLAGIGAGAAGIGLKPELADAAFPAPAPPASHVVSQALVLSGGGARGAYQAGFICGLGQRAALVDGEPFAPYGLVCGSSIGAINGWFVATGNYSALREAWATVASHHLVELKHRYHVLMRPGAFVGDKLLAAVRLALGVMKRERGVAQSQPILDWMAKTIDPSAPVLIPLVWAVTNLTTQAPEYFYRLPASFNGQIPEPVAQALRLTLGESIVIREVPDALLHRALLASAAIPIVFDPVPLPMLDGTEGMYIDGSIASNAAVTIARTVAKQIHVVLVDPPTTRSTYANAIDIAIGAYATMQHEILEAAMRDVFLESEGQRSLAQLALTPVISAHAESSEVRTFMRDVPAAELSFVRPKTHLPVDITAFDQQPLIDQTFAIGEQSAQTGFVAYDWQTFHA
jgi:predicted acylesterase/phospholipase RssA